MAEYIIKEWTDKKGWDSFLQKQKKQANFLQSWSWGDFLMKKNKVYRIVATGKNDEIVSIVQLNKENIKFSKKYYLYAAYGPIWQETLANNEKRKILNQLSQNIPNIIKDKNLAYLQFESNLEDNKENRKIFEHWQAQNHDLQPHDSLIIPIHQSAEEILEKMHSKTRYNIRLAEKKGIEIIWDKSGQYFEDWFKIMQETAQRNKIRLLPKSHYKRQVEENALELVVAKFENKIIAGNLVSLSPPTAVYVHGASSTAYQNLMATYLLQWHSILKAKENNCEFFDFWGINVNNRHPQWAGITRFKIGFNPQETPRTYLGTYIYKYKSFYYYFNQFWHKLRQIKKFVLTR